MAFNSTLNITGSSGLLSGVITTVNTLLGGSSTTSVGSTGGTGTTTGGSASKGLINTGSLDGLLDIKLLNPNAVANLSLFDADRDGDGLINLSLLDKDGDGLIDIGLLNKSVGVALLDPNGDGLIDLNVLDAVKVNAGTSLGGNSLTGSTGAAAYQVVLTGTNGADNFAVSTKSTFVNGLGGQDTVSYAKSSSGITIKVEANGAFVSDGTKVDYLQNVERVMFSDGTLALDTGAGEHAGMAFRLYQAAFDRLPDMDGLKFWINKLDMGNSITSVANGFLQSPEFQKAYGSLSNTAFVDELYDNVLHRDGEASGMKYWTDKLDTGTASRADVLIGFAESGENCALVGTKIDCGVFLC